MNTGVHVYFVIMVFYGYMPRNGIAGLYGGSNTFYQVLSAGIFMAVSASAGPSHHHSFPHKFLRPLVLKSLLPPPLSPHFLISSVVSTMQSSYIYFSLWMSELVHPSDHPNRKRKSLQTVSQSRSHMWLPHRSICLCFNFINMNLGDNNRTTYLYFG